MLDSIKKEPCRRHPRVPACVKRNVPSATTLSLSAPSPPKITHSATVSLLLSAPVAAYVPAWYARAAVRNWLRFTIGSTLIVLHMDRARTGNFTEPEWRWLHDGSARERVLLNPHRMNTYRRSGSLLTAHVRNYMHARSTLLRSRPPSHVLFLASNCFFIRPGVEAFVEARESTAAIRACPEAPVRANKHHCTTHAWFAELNRHKTTGRRLLIEGQFYPTALMDELVLQLTSRDSRGQPLSPPAAAAAATAAAASATGAAPAARNHSSLMDALPLMPCTAEENLLPALVLRAHASLFGRRGGKPATEPVAWIPKSLSNGSVVESATVRWLLGSSHTPQSLCKPLQAGAGGCGVCPDPRLWPQTKFIVKRVADDSSDRSGVRRLIAGLPSDIASPAGPHAGHRSSVIQESRRVASRSTLNRAGQYALGLNVSGGLSSSTDS